MYIFKMRKPSFHLHLVMIVLLDIVFLVDSFFLWTLNMLTTAFWFLLRYQLLILLEFYLSDALFFLCCIQHYFLSLIVSFLIRLCLFVDLFLFLFRVKLKYKCSLSFWKRLGAIYFSLFFLQARSLSWRFGLGLGDSSWSWSGVLGGEGAGSTEMKI